VREAVLTQNTKDTKISKDRDPLMKI